MYLVRAAGPPTQILTHGLSKLPVKSAGTGCQKEGRGTTEGGRAGRPINWGVCMYPMYTGIYRLTE